MKKILLLCATLALAISASAVTPEEVKASQDRIEKLKKAEKPDYFGLSDIRAYGDKAWELKNNTVSINETLEKFYTDEDTVVLTIDECENVYKRIQDQTKLLGDIAPMAGKATADVKNAKGTDKVKAPKSVKAITDVVSTVTEETTYQAKLIAEIMAAIVQ